MRHARFLGGDHLGSTALITNANGRRVDRLSYGPWGEPLEGNHNRVRFTYTGHQRERATGSYYSVYRYLDPKAGRWGQRDPLKARDGQNRYAYVRNLPLGYTDPLGLKIRIDGGFPQEALALVQRTEFTRKLWQELEDDCRYTIVVAGSPYALLTDWKTDTGKTMEATEAFDKFMSDPKRYGLAGGLTEGPTQNREIAVTLFFGTFASAAVVPDELLGQLQAGDKLALQAQRTTIRLMKQEMVQHAVAGALVHELSHAKNKKDGLPRPHSLDFYYQLRFWSQLGVQQ